MAKRLKFFLYLSAALIPACRGEPRIDGAAHSGELDAGDTKDWWSMLKVDRPEWSVPVVEAGSQAELRLRLTLPARETGEMEEERPWVAYPRAELTADDPRVVVSGGETTVFGLFDGMDCQCRFKVEFPSAIPDGTTIRFRAMPAGPSPESTAKPEPFLFSVTLGKPIAEASR